MYYNLIYKETYRAGTLYSLEPIEIDEDENNAHKFAKLYNLQLPLDQKEDVNYRVYSIDIS